MSGIIRRSLFLVVALTPVLEASVPNLISYQGQLTTTEGDPYADGSYSLTFSLFAVPAGGQSLWTETHPDVAVTNGLFSVTLGSVTPLSDSVFSGPEKYLEVQIGSDLILPRTRVTSGVYAQRVATLDGASGGVVTAPLILVAEATVPGGVSVAGPAAVATARVEITVIGDQPSVSFWEPVDSKGGALADAVKKIELRREGIIMFGDSENDTNLIVAPNGDIIGVGQITMGENSSSGIETSVLGFRNDAQGDSSTIGGGSSNTTTGTLAVIAGGHSNVANGEGSTISGGAFQTNNGYYGTIGGGYGNSVAGQYATIPGGRSNIADGAGAFAFGYRANALHDGAIVWADQTEADFSSTAENQFIIRAQGGVGIGTDSPIGQLDVVAAPGNQSVNFPNDAIASPEILDEPGLAGVQSGANWPLTQGSLSVNQVASTAITTPADGYIVVRGIATFEGSGTSGRNQAYLQVDDTQGGGLVAPYFVLVGSGDNDIPNSRHYFNASVERIFYKPAGTHTFYLEGLAHESNNSDALSVFQRPYLSAIFIPTAYGAVSEQ